MHDFQYHYDFVCYYYIIFNDIIHIIIIIYNHIIHKDRFNTLYYWTFYRFIFNRIQEFVLYISNYDDLLYITIND